MIISDIIAHRLINQQIAETKFKRPEEIVSWLGAIQAQEYAMSKWAIGLRLPDVNDEKVEKAFNAGAILRTHLLRPTWHFVTPADIRWMLLLTAPRVNAMNAFMYRKCELDISVFKKTNNILIKSLQGGKQLTRAVLNKKFEKAKIQSDGIRLSLIMMRAELDGVICSGVREGKQFTYTLLEERVPATKTLNHAEALAELSKRYFLSRGPATIQDFVVWSGLTMKEAKDGIASLSSYFVREKINGKEYIFASNTVTIKDKHQTTFLMPDYDEYGMGYKDRSAIFSPEKMTTSIRGNNPVFNRMIIIDGKIEGTWKRTIKNNSIVVETFPFTKLAKAKEQKVKNAVKRFSSFVGKSLED